MYQALLFPCNGNEVHYESMFTAKILRAQHKQTVDLGILFFLSARTELAFLSEKSSAILEKYYHSINHEKRDRPSGAGYVICNL